MDDFIAYTVLSLSASQAKLRHSGLYQLCRSQHFWEPDFVILWRSVGRMEGFFLELACASLIRSFRLRPRSLLHFVESFTHVQGESLKAAGVFHLSSQQGT